MTDIFLKDSVTVKITTLTITIVAPAGKSRKNDAVIPASTEMKAAIIEISIAPLKPLAICRDVTAGRISRAETSITPTTLTASTTVIAVIKVSMRFIRSVLMPVILAYSSSKVAENKSL